MQKYRDKCSLQLKILFQSLTCNTVEVKVLKLCIFLYFQVDVINIATNECEFCHIFN